MPIYFLLLSEKNHKWNVIYPLTNSQIYYPSLPDVDGVTLLQPSHFELLYHENFHYDAVVAAHCKIVSPDNPILTGSESEIINLCD